MCMDCDRVLGLLFDLHVLVGDALERQAVVTRENQDLRRRLVRLESALTSSAGFKVFGRDDDTEKMYTERAAPSEPAGSC